VDSILTDFYSVDLHMPFGKPVANRPMRLCELEYRLCRDLARNAFVAAKQACERQQRISNGIWLGAKVFASCTAVGGGGGGLIGFFCGIPGGPPGMLAVSGTGVIIGGVGGACVGVISGAVCCIDEWANETDRCIERAAVAFANACKNCRTMRTACYDAQDIEWGIPPYHAE
jgi:hypothetical protein